MHRGSPSGAYGATTYTYNASTGGLRSVSDPTGGTLSFGSDGKLQNMEMWGGAGHVRGYVSRAYDANFWLASLGVNGTTVASFAYDRDGLMISTGPMRMARDAQTGDVSASLLGGITTEQQMNTRGEPQSYHASYQGASVYSEEVLARDAIGRITSRRETVQGVAQEYTYHYDTLGQLSDVRINGNLARHYEYDANGNRTEIGGNAAVSCSHDSQDRVVDCGDKHYEFNEVGQLARVSQSGASTAYDYDVVGNLRAVTLPDGKTVEYEIDARDRRIGKRVSGVRQWGLLYQSELAPIAQVDAQNRAVSVFIYATRGNVPDYMVKGGVTYRFVVDHLGSVREVVSVVTGSVAQRIDYDEFGNVLMDTNPGFQPFGFGGGLYDADTGLVQFGARNYDAVTGRWTSKDPILFAAGPTNLYEYCRNDPIDCIDPSGLEGGSFGGGGATGSWDPDEDSDSKSRCPPDFSGLVDALVDALASSPTSPTPLLTSDEIERLRPTGEQNRLINALFKTGVDNPALTRETLENYEKLAQNALEDPKKSSPRAVAEQTRRLGVVEEVLKSRGVR